MITGFNHFTIAVKDIEKSFDFYQKVLGFKPLLKWPDGAYFLAGDSWFCLSKSPDGNVSASSDYTHLAFSVTQNDFEKVNRKIVDSGTIIFKQNKSEGESLYFLDPDGHKLEIHVGDWQSRLDFFRVHPKTGMVFYD